MPEIVGSLGSHLWLRYEKIRVMSEAVCYSRRPRRSLASNTRSSPIEEIVEKLRDIKENHPELYKEAWSKIPHKTQTAIQEYESHHKHNQHNQSDTHHKTTHEPAPASTHFSHNYPHAKSYEDQHRNPSSHHEARDWEAPARTHEPRSHTSEPSTMTSNKETNHRLSSPTLSANHDSEKSESIRTKSTSSPGSSEESEKALRKSISAEIPKAHEIMKQAAKEEHLPTSLQEVLLATTVYELELIRIGLDKLTKQLAKQ